MKRRAMKKVMALLLGTVMTAGLLTGCGNSGSTGTASADTAESSAADEAAAEADTAGEATETAIDTSEHVDLKLYLVGDKNEDFDEVWAKINETLEEKLNATLNVEYLGWGEQDTKYSLLFSSGEIGQITKWDELVDFYMACAADGIYGCRETPWLEYCRQSGLYAINGAPLDGELVTYNVLDSGDLTLNYMLDWDGFAEYCKLAKEMADAGVWSKDVLNTNDE
ncbi:MAG: hypothetical protein Q4C58_02745 [Eubacteriales bacterium]|nr:hypothetical protein [Eubacteriales bacterium]